MRSKLRGSAAWVAATLFFGIASMRVFGQSVSAIYSFAGPDGAYPYAGLIQASDGNFYGTTDGGGADGYGSIFKMTPSGTLTTLYSFTGGSDGSYPTASLIQASDGNFYGTTGLGGPFLYTFGPGTVFKSTPSGTLTTLYTFTGGSDGEIPNGLLQAADGNLYGTTEYGGIASGSSGYGTVFKITLAGTLTTLHAFSATDGAWPFASLIQASDGNLYGTTYGGGVLSGGYEGYGTIFKITPAGTLTTLYTIGTSPTDASAPAAPLVQASDGDLYGTIYGLSPNRPGMVFKITTSSTFTSLHTFSSLTNGVNSDGANPIGGLIQTGGGNLYGTTLAGGTNGNGTIFQITPSGMLTTFYTFSPLNSNGINSDGAYPYAGLLQASDGSLYGTTVNGGANGYGDVFRLHGVYPAPKLSSLSPSSKDAGAPAFTLSVKGSNFQSFSTIDWNGSPLATTYVSSTQLKASVPASLIVNAGAATVSVVTAAGGGTSNTKPFTILVTTLKLSAASLSKNADGSYTANVTLKNTGYEIAANLSLTSATLGTAATTTSLPLSLGDIAAGASAHASLSFPASAGSSGQKVSLKVAGKFTGGTLSSALKVTLP